MANYTAFIYDPSEACFRTTESESWGGFRSKGSFARELRANGYRVRRIEFTEVYDYVVSRTNCESSDWEAARLAYRKGDVGLFFDAAKREIEKAWRERHDAEMKEFIAGLAAAV